jgi:hypothetical protein
MKVKQISLDDEEMPERVLVDLSHDEALYLALMLGKQNHNDMNQVMPSGATHGEAVYDGLAGGLFNRFYDDGVQGAAEAVRSRA